MFVFRNNTIERFSPSHYSFSGYDDVSFVPNDADGYVWFYQVPMKWEAVAWVYELAGLLQKAMQFKGVADGREIIVIDGIENHQVARKLINIYQKVCHTK